ncbi:hypothetical protein CHUV0807_0271 [Cardiobacterium hominis]|uniref:Uncharacterized protein n=1 Tax=Cardiobacterium hominis TaxID=2718 RepID=A0A1C3H2E9_9GAMM|nr:hypothetical protein CHUV0807_0271 [Cardiobacterium hominis]
MRRAKIGGHYNHDGIGTGFIQVKGEQEAIAMMARAIWHSACIAILRKPHTLFRCWGYRVRLGAP